MYMFNSDATFTSVNLLREKQSRPNGALVTQRVQMLFTMFSCSAWEEFWNGRFGMENDLCAQVYEWRLGLR